MALPDANAGVGHSFGLELDGVEVAGFAEVSGLTLEQDVVETKQQGPDGTYVVRRLPGRWKAGEVTLTRGLTSDRSLDAWVRGATEGTDAARRDVAVVLRDEEGQTVRRFTLVGAWPSKLEIGTVAADGTPLLTEKLVVTYERLDVE